MYLFIVCNYKIQNSIDYLKKKHIKITYQYIVLTLVRIANTFNVYKNRKMFLT